MQIYIIINEYKTKYHISLKKNNKTFDFFFFKIKDAFKTLVVLPLPLSIFFSMLLSILHVTALLLSTEQHSSSLALKSAEIIGGICFLLLLLGCAGV